VDELLNMSNREITRLEVMQRLKEKRLTQKEASRLLRISIRQVKRLFWAYKAEGTLGLVSQRRGKPSNHQLDPAIVQQVIDLIYERYRDFGPTLAHEKLTKIHGLHLSRESVRRIMISEGLWKPKRAKQPHAHQMRERHACFGELVQINGSDYDWFEGRGPRCTLLVFVDDANNEIIAATFQEEEDAAGYFLILQQVCLHKGLLSTLYADQHTIFQRPSQPTIEQELSGELPRTQFGRLVDELGIQLITARSPQAKGRGLRLHPLARRAPPGGFLLLQVLPLSV